VPVALQQGLAEFLFETVDLLDERGDMNAESGCGRAEGGVASELLSA
jgi:hypothetical protein